MSWRAVWAAEVKNLMNLEDLLEKLVAANVGDTIADADGNPFAVLRGRNGCRYVQVPVPFRCTHNRRRATTTWHSY